MKKVIPLFIFAGMFGGIGWSEHLELRMKSIVDTQGFGYDALSLLAPADWVLKGGVGWMNLRTGPSPIISWTLTSPDGRASVENFPSAGFVYFEDPALQSTYTGLNMEYLPPQSAADYLKNVYLPRYRQGISGLKIITEKSMPEYARQVASRRYYLLTEVYHSISPLRFRPEVSADAVYAEIEYSENGTIMVEGVTITTVYSTAYMTGAWGNPTSAITWSAGILSCRSPKASASAFAPVFLTVINSARINPRFEIDAVRLSATVAAALLRRQDEYFSAMRRITESRMQVSDTIMDTYRRTSDSRDRIFENYGGYVRGVDSYRDPSNGRNVELPSGYDRAWVHGDTYIVSDDPSYDPNVGSTFGWERLEPIR